MSSAVALRGRGDRTWAAARSHLRRAAHWAWGAPLEIALVVALTAVAARFRTHALGAHFWIDEGISVGISSHPLSQIPGLLRQDGSPPLYYLLLHWWMELFGRSESSTHALSAVFAIAAVPAGWWAARPFGREAGLACAALLTINPFLGLYADETRMYSLVLLEALLATGAFVRAFVLRRRPMAIPFALLIATLLYTHAWGAFFAGAAGLAWLGLIAAGPDRRGVAIDGALAFGGAFLLYVPWLPTLAYQAAHTAAPWSHRPSGASLGRAVRRIWGQELAEVLILLVTGGGLIELLRRGSPAHRRGALAVLGITALTLVSAWAYSHWGSPAWALRYLVIVLAPFAVVAGIGLGRLPILGVATVALVFLLAWHAKPSIHTLTHKSNVANVASALRRDLPPGTIVFSTQPEQVPNLHYYLPPGLRYRTPLGPVRDTGVMDWRDAMKRLNAARYATAVAPVIRAMRPGDRILLVQPLFSSPDSPWTVRIHHIARHWGPALRHSSDLRIIKVVKPYSSSRSPVDGILLVRTHGGAHAHGGNS